MAGWVRLARLVVAAALKRGRQSLLHYREMKMRELPGMMFANDYRTKLK
jgi:hypothetical protein